MPVAIEPLADYVGQTACDQRTGPGTRRLATMLSSTFAAATPTTWATVYACGTDGTRSEHYDGRALDWMVDVRNPVQRAAASAAVQWLLAPDAAGNRFAMARRLGVMYVIWNNRMWGAWSGRWENYNGCQAAAMQRAEYANACHRSHLHISLSWAGAQARTSYWTSQVAATDYGPCRPADLNWAPRRTGVNPTPCRDYPAVTAPKRSTAVKRTLVMWSGAYAARGDHGPVVTAVQQALHLPASGRYDAATAAAVGGFQAAHAVAVTRTMTQATWRALLTATR